MQQSLIDSSIIQSTTVKTIKELKNQANQHRKNEINDQTLSGKNIPEDEASKTQNKKITLDKKQKLTFKQQSQNQITSIKQTIIKTSDDIAEQSYGFRRASLKQDSLRIQKPQPQIQLELNDPIDMNNALNLIVNKCKTIKKEFEQLQAPKIFSGLRFLQIMFLHIYRQKLLIVYLFKYSYVTNTFT